MANVGLVTKSSLTPATPWTIALKEIKPECSLEGLMLKLNLQYFGHLMGRADSLDKTLTLGKTAVKTRRGGQRLRWVGHSTESVGVNVSELWETVGVWGARHAVVHGLQRAGWDLSTKEQQRNLQCHCFQVLRSKERHLRDIFYISMLFLFACCDNGKDYSDHPAFWRKY